MRENVRNFLKNYLINFQILKNSMNKTINTCKKKEVYSCICPLWGHGVLNFSDLYIPSDGTMVVGPRKGSAVEFKYLPVKKSLVISIINTYLLNVKKYGCPCWSITKQTVICVEVHIWFHWEGYFNIKLLK